MTAITQSGQVLDQVSGLLGRGRAAMVFSAMCLVVIAAVCGLALRDISEQSVPRSLVSSVQ